MKQIKTSMLLMLLLASAASCTDEKSEYLPQLYVSFTPAVTASTRAHSGEYPQDVPFGVWIYSLGENKSWEKNRQEATLLADNSIVTYNGGRWTNTPPVEWQGKQRLTVFAHSPYDDNVRYSNSKGVTIEDFDVTRGVYPLFTNSVVDCSGKRNGGCIALPFVPTLAKVEFRVRSMAQADSTLRVRSLTMENVHYKGSFQSFPQATWTATDETMSIEFCSSPMMVGCSSQTVGTQMVLPQTVLHHVTLTVDVYDGNGALVVPGRKIVSRAIEGEWNVGKYYTYTLNLTTGSVTFTTDILDNYDARNR